MIALALSGCFFWGEKIDDSPQAPKDDAIRIGLASTAALPPEAAYELSFDATVADPSTPIGGEPWVDQGDLPGRLVLVADGGDTWWLSYGEERMWEDVTPAVNAAVGARVHLSFATAPSDFHTPLSGFALSDADGLVAAWYADNGPSDLPFTVSAGGAVDGGTDDCSDFTLYETVFEADDRVVVAPFDSAALAVDGRAMIARNVEHYDHAEACDWGDTGLQWIVTR